MENCSICKEDMDKEQNYILSCNHRFHTSCIIDSLRINPECPICRDTGIKNQKKIQTNSNEIYYGDLYSNLKYYCDMNHTDYCICCSIKNKENLFFDIYSTLSEIIDSDNELINIKKNALKKNHKLKREIISINNIVKRDIHKLRRDAEKILKEYYDYKINSNEFLNISENVRINKPLAQQFGKLLENKIDELHIYNDSDVIMVINYITYELFQWPFKDNNNNFYKCSKWGSYDNRLFFDRLLKIAKKNNKKVNTSSVNIIT
jgi:hypothetical protein